MKESDPGKETISFDQPSLMKITSYQLYHNIVQCVKIKINFDKKIKPAKVLRGVGGEKTVKLQKFNLFVNE